MKKWRTLKSKYLINNNWVKVRQDKVRLPGGTVIDDYYVSESKQWVIIVPHTTDGKLILTRQYKHGWGGELIEFPAGFIEPGENPAKSAERELLEETGYIAAKIEPMGGLTNNPTQVHEHFYAFRATGCKKVAEPNFDITEDIETLLKTPDEVLQMIKDGEIMVSSSITVGLLDLLVK